jgi:hypothetical protein
VAYPYGALPAYSQDIRPLARSSRHDEGPYCRLPSVSFSARTTIRMPHVKKKKYVLPPSLWNVITLTADFVDSGIEEPRLSDRPT